MPSEPSKTPCFERLHTSRRANIATSVRTENPQGVERPQMCFCFQIRCAAAPATGKNARLPTTALVQRQLASPRCSLGVFSPDGSVTLQFCLYRSWWWRVDLNHLPWGYEGRSTRPGHQTPRVSRRAGRGPRYPISPLVAETGVNAVMRALWVEIGGRFLPPFCQELQTQRRREATKIPFHRELFHEPRMCNSVRTKCGPAPSWPRGKLS